MKRIRVLVIDDSVTVRQLLVDALSADPEVHVVGTAPNGALGVTLLPRLVPDVVVLDVDMPVMDGLAFLQRVRPAWPKLPIIVFSTHTTHGAETTLQAMWFGATDYVAKPSASDFESAVQQARRDLLPRIKAFARRDAAAAGPAPPRAGALAASAGPPPRRVPRRARPSWRSARPPAARARWPSCSGRCPPTFPCRC